VGDLVISYLRQLLENLSFNFATWQVLIANENFKKIIVAT